MIFKNGIYDKLKWFCLIGLPAIITFFGVMGNTLEWNFTEPVVIIATAFNTMLGTMLGISNIRYNKQTELEYGDDGEIDDEL